MEKPTKPFNRKPDPVDLYAGSMLNALRCHRGLSQEALGCGRRG
jgi:hypothetical protein